MRNATVPTRIPLEGGPIIDVDLTEQHLEVTISCAGRAHAGIALARPEARSIAAALANAAAEGQPLEAPAEDPFTSTLPNDAGPDFPATEARIFPSIEGHTEPLDVLALLEPDHGVLVHVGGACLTADGARTLVAHLSGILTATERTPA